jgi:ribonuclease HI
MEAQTTSLSFPCELPALDALPARSTFFTGAGKPALIRGHQRAQQAWLNAPESLVDMLRRFPTEGRKASTRPVRPLPQPAVNCDLCIRFDGCTQGNPGPMGIGIACFTPADPDNPVQVYCMPVQFDGEPVIGTNNLTEILAAIQALWISSQIIDTHPGTQILVQGDSLNCVRWINGEFRLNEEKLAPFVGYAQSLLESLRPCGVHLDHIRREFNFVADDLSKEALGLEPEEYGRWSLRIAE